MLRIRLLGALDLRYGDAPLPPLQSARAESLLAYLLLHPDAPQSRQHLAFLLWPDSTEPQARTNLRHLLHTLRRALPEADRFLDVAPRTLQWRPDAPVWLDVTAFAEAISRAEHAADGGLTALREAVELYSGDLLDGCYDEWLLGERERLRARYLEALARLTALLDARGDHSEAIRYADRRLRHDPLDEETYRLLMRLHDARGDRARALRVYYVCAATLERELGVEPSARTQETYEALLSPAGEPPVTERPAGRIGGPPLVGRGPERAHLTACWRAAEGGRAQLVLVTGEPGIGKSRLVEEFRSWCAHRGAVTAEARSYAAEGALAYGPVVAWLRSTSLKPRLDRLDRPRLSELARLLPELLAEIPGLARPEPLPEGDQRQRLFDAVTRAIGEAGGPVLLVADDLQWCDQETLHFLHYLLRAEPGAPLLVAATARREEIDQRHPLNDLVAGIQAMDRFAEIPIDRLTQEETGILAERIGGRSFGVLNEERLYRETEGNPLFVVEALRAGWTSGQAPEPGRAGLSPKVQSAIDARLAQLTDPARDLVGVAATIGRAFTSDVLAAASEGDADEFVRALDELWRRRIVREQGVDAYDFSHDKIREVAYLAMSPARRRRNHHLVAHALERRHAGDLGTVSGQIAAHHERAGAADVAVTWYVRAAEAARQLYANVETIRLLDRAIDLLRTLPDTAKRRAEELTLLTALPAPLWAVEGFSSDRMDEVHRRALAIARELGVEPEPPLLRSLAIASLSDATTDFAAAERVGKQLHARGQRDADDMLVVESEYVLGITAFWQGSFAVARGHFEAAVERYRPEQRRLHLIRFGLDPQAICLSRLGNTLWCLGYPEAAARARDAAVALADEIGHPFTRSTVTLFGAMLSLELGDQEWLRRSAATLEAEPDEQITRPTRIATQALAGYIDVVDGRPKTGIARIRRALEEVRGADPAPGHRSYVFRLLIESCAAAGLPRDGLAAADQALRLTNPAPFCQAEAHRFRAVFLTALGASAPEIETAFGQAIAVARRQGAISLELRAASSLLRWRLASGDGSGASEARSRLATIVAEFPERHAIQLQPEVAKLLNDG